MLKIITLLILLTPLQIVAQSLSMDSCKYFAGMVNVERAKRHKKILEYQESSQTKVDKSARVASIWYEHKNTEYCAETLSGQYTMQKNLESLMASKPHRKALMGNYKKICVGIFLKNSIYYTVVRVYQ